MEIVEFVSLALGRIDALNSCQTKLLVKLELSHALLMLIDRCVEVT